MGMRKRLLPPIFLLFFFLIFLTTYLYVEAKPTTPSPKPASSA